MRRLLRLVGWALVVVVVAGILASFGLYRAAQQEPEFYTQAVVVPPEEQAEAGDELERRLLDLRSDATQQGTWEARFSQEQINGWLASDMPEKFPALLPSGASEPRVCIKPALLQAACRYKDARISAVVSVSADVYLTDEPNVIAVRLRRVRAGAIPLPLGQFLDQISSQAAEAGIPLQWSEQEGDPLALVTIPQQVDARTQAELQLETLELREGELVLAGHTRTAQSAEKRAIQR